MLDLFDEWVCHNPNRPIAQLHAIAQVHASRHSPNCRIAEPPSRLIAQLPNCRNAGGSATTLSSPPGPTSVTSCVKSSRREARSCRTLTFTRTPLTPSSSPSPSPSHPHTLTPASPHPLTCTLTCSLTHPPTHPPTIGPAGGAAVLLPISYFLLPTIGPAGGAAVLLPLQRRREDLGLGHIRQHRCLWNALRLAP